MSLCEAWKESMICWVTACELPGLLDQKVISLAGVILDQSVASEEAAAAPPPPEVLGPPQAARAAAVPTAPARPRKRRRSRAAWVSADGMRAGMTNLQRAAVRGGPGERAEGCQSLTAPWVSPETM